MKISFSLSLGRLILCNETFCYRKAREDLDAKSQKLAEMEADYGDVVPRRDFERLEAQFNVRTFSSKNTYYRQ